jgi:hypothetical protein
MEERSSSASSLRSLTDRRGCVTLERAEFDEEEAEDEVDAGDGFDEREEEEEEAAEEEAGERLADRVRTGVARSMDDSSTSDSTVSSWTDGIGSSSVFI